MSIYHVIKINKRVYNTCVCYLKCSACKSIKRHIESAVKELSLKSFRLFEEELHDVSN